MLNKLATLKDNFSKADEIVKNFDFSTLVAAVKNYSTSALQNLPNPEKERIAQWIHAVKEIKASDQTIPEKQKKLEALTAPTLVFDIIKKHLAALAESKSISSKHTAQTVLENAIALAGPGPIIASTILSFGLNKILPKLILRSEADPFIESLEKLVKNETG